MSSENEITTITFDPTAVEAQERALIDKQITTAKTYPRNVHRVRDNIIAIASMDEETAKACGYVLPRGGKNISGPSVHLARIVVQQYGNIRVESKVVDTGATHITGQATCIDLENNVGIRVEVKRRITNSKGDRYNDDMITVAGNAATSIALRNAVFNVVPKPLVDAGYKAAQQKITGDISDETKLIARRKAVLDGFQKSYGVSDSDVLRVLGLREITQIKGEELVTIIGLAQAIKDGDTTVDESFFPDKGKTTKDKKEDKETERVEIMIAETETIEQLTALKKQVSAKYHHMFTEREAVLNGNK